MKLITIPIAVATPHFKWQISYFQYQHIKVYGDDARNRAIIAVVNRNERDKPIVEDIDWNLKLPYVMVDSVLDIYDVDDLMYIPTNCYTALRQVLLLLSDNDYIELIDSDMAHLRPYSGDLPKDDEVFADNRYEDWHMFISKKNGKNRHIINKYLKHDDEGYMNGGSNIIVRVSTMKKLIDEVINVGMDIAVTNKGTPHAWWQSMYAINVSCHNNRVKMVNSDSCYYPNINELDLAKHHMVHFSCDPLFAKKDFPTIDITAFPNNLFYNNLKDWIYNI